MKTMLKEKAIHYLQMGLPVIPINKDTKKPAVLWKEYQTRLPTIEEASSWKWSAIALLTGPTSGYAVVDCDTKEAGKYWYTWRPSTPMVAQSKRGFHFYYQDVGIKSATGIPLNSTLAYDVKAYGSYVIVDPSPGYKWLWGIHPAEELPLFNRAWRPVKETIGYTAPVAKNPTTADQAIDRILDTAVKEAVAGRNQAGFRMALQLRDHGISLGECLTIMDDYAGRVRHLREGVYDATEARNSARSAYSGKRREPWNVRSFAQ